MNTVKRYRAGDFVPVPAVGASDYDAAQSELAALREQLTLTEESNAGLSSTISADVIAYKKVCDELASEKKRYARDVDEADEEASALRECIRDLKGWRECSQSLAAFASIIERAEAVIPAPGPLRTALTAAEQRIANLCGLLVRTLPVVRMVGRQDHLCDYAMAGNIQAEIETTLNPQPTESDKDQPIGTH